MTLTLAQSRALVRLLGQYQDFLENAIDCELIPEGDTEIDGQSFTIKSEPTDPDTCRRMARDRKRWQQCENFLKLLAPPRKRRAQK